GGPRGRAPRERGGWGAQSARGEPLGESTGWWSRSSRCGGFCKGRRHARATRIRLRRVGRKGQSYFRIVVADSRSPRDGRFVVTLGHYNPRTNPADIKVDTEQARAWLDKGALPTDTVRSLLKKAGVLGKRPA